MKPALRSAAITTTRLGAGKYPRLTALVRIQLTGAFAFELRRYE
jgi:hypothetical protein